MINLYRNKESKIKNLINRVKEQITNISILNIKNKNIWVVQNYLFGKIINQTSVISI